MAHTETFYVSAKDNKLRKVNTNPVHLILGGKAKYSISIFGNGNHKKVAKQAQEMVEREGLNIFQIKIKTR